MPSPTGTAKICTICSEDCSAKPRTKDSHGRYYCRGCYERVRARKGGGASAHLEDKLATDGDELGGPLALLDKIVELSAPTVRTTPCANCGYAVSEGVIVCTHCG